MNSQDLLVQATIAVKESLKQFANKPLFADKMELAFDKNADISQLKASWQAGEFVFPQIEIISSSDLNGANGAFSKDTNKIYLAQEFLLANLNNSDAVTDVFLEEYGHFVDSTINPVDSAGDEGAIFSALVREEKFKDIELQRLKKEDDSAIAVIDGEVHHIEQHIEIDGEIVHIENELIVTPEYPPGTAENPTIIKFPNDEFGSRGELKFDISYKKDNYDPVHFSPTGDAIPISEKRKKSDGSPWTGIGRPGTSAFPPTAYSGNDTTFLSLSKPGELFDLKVAMINKKNSEVLEEVSVPGHYLFVGDADLEISDLTYSPDSVFDAIDITIVNNGPNVVEGAILELTIPEEIDADKLLIAGYESDVTSNNGDQIVKIDIDDIISPLDGTIDTYYTVDSPLGIRILSTPITDDSKDSASDSNSWVEDITANLIVPRWINDTNLANNQYNANKNTDNCLDTGALNLELEGGEFKDTDGDGDCDGKGTVYIGHKDGTKRMLRVDNAHVQIFDDTILFLDGTVYSLIGNSNIKSEALFNINSLNIPTGSTSSSSLLEKENDADNDEFEIAGLDISFDGLNINPNSFDLGGKFTLPEKAGGLEVKLSGDELLRIENDDVRFTNRGKINPEFNAAFDLFSAVAIKSAEPTLSYDDQKDELKLQGKYTLKQPLIKIAGNSEINLDLAGKENFIKIKDKKTDFQGEFSLKNLKLTDSFEFPELKLGLKTENEELTEISGKVKAKFPVPTNPIVKDGLGVGVDLEFKIDPFSLNKFILELSDLNIPAPPPTGPTFIDSIKGGLIHIAPDDDDPITFMGELGLTFGPKKSFNTNFLTETILGIDINADIALVSAKLTGELNSEKAKGSVKIKIIDDQLFNGVGTLTWDWNKDIITYTGGAEAINGVFRGGASFKFDEAKSTFTGAGNVTINVPDNPLFWGHRGKRLAGAFFQGLYTADSNDSDDYIAAWATISLPNPGASSAVRSATAGIKYYFDGSFEPILSGKEIPITGSWDIEPDLEWLMLTVRWENATDEDVSIRVENEKGEFINEADFAANNIAIVDDLSGSNTKTVIIDAPNPGVWDIELVDDTGLGEVEYIAHRDTAAPTIEITAPAVDVSGGEVTIDYEAFDADSEAKVQLFYDDDNDGFDGVLITNELIEQDSADTFLWNTQGVATGEYYIYGMIMDDENAPVFNYSSGKVLISEAADLNVTQTVDAESVNVGEEQTYTVTITNNGENDSQGVSLTHTIPEGATFVSATVDPSEQSDNNFTFSLGNLAKGESTSVDISVNASNIIGTSISNSVASSSTYDPNRSNNTASLATSVTEGISLSINDISLNEANDSNKEFIFDVSLSEVSDETITVDYATANDSAVADEDYLSASGTLEFVPGETRQIVTVEVMSDSKFEPDEAFMVNISNASNATISDAQGVGIITNEEVDSLEPTLDGAAIGNLDNNDDHYTYDDRNYYFDFYAVPYDSLMNLGDTAKITVSSDDFDPVLMILDGEGNVVEDNNNLSAGSTTAEVSYEIGSEPFFVSIESMAAESFGEYQLDVEVI